MVKNNRHFTSLQKWLVTSGKPFSVYPIVSTHRILTQTQISHKINTQCYPFFSEYHCTTRDIPRFGGLKVFRFSTISSNIGWFNTSLCCNALISIQYVFGTAVNVHAIHKSMHKFFTTLKLCFHLKNEGRIDIQLDRRVRKTVKLRPVKSKVKLFQFQNSVFPNSSGFQWVMLAVTTVGI